MVHHEWISKEFDDICLGDKRLNKRLKTVATQFFLNAESTIPSACEGWSGAKACYRFFKNPKVNARKILETHRQKSLQRIGETETVLIVQDTTFIDYSTHYQTKGLGGISKDSKGLIMHSSLALSEDGIPVGFLGQKIFARPFVEGLKKRNRHATPIQDKESYRWLESFHDSIEGFSNTQRLVTITDREGDMYELMLEIDKKDSNFLIRIRQDRAINQRFKRSPVQQRMWNYMSQQTPVGYFKTEIQYVNKHVNRWREVELSVKIGSFTIQAPQQSRNRVLNAPRPIKVYAIYVQEINPQKGENPIEWMLLTNLSTIDFETALVRIRWYKYRWLIELFHKILKSGYQVESCRLSEAERLIRYLTVMSIISFRILSITYLQKYQDSVKADVIFTPDELVILSLWSNRLGKNISSPLSLVTAVKILAQKGGFFNRKSDETPGFITIWRGLRKLAECIDSCHMIIENLPIARVTAENFLSCGYF
ncbi:transposase Tn5 [Legionella busanensis]|uniref:Transposase Tn5 n=1 Tax=Legionella busanensis TaxID=190655 RepID=A0A378JI95_9GAMM|nr:IS4 family transposase [Legionella busanensis]STX50759.1 transposase Tn5 [Legionella busanensis]STX50915.1 transposase Tn5 [Legionella busanensis]